MKKPARNKPRNWVAVVAKHRKAGPMEHRNTPRGGDTNKSVELLKGSDDEWAEEDVCTATTNIMHALAVSCGREANHEGLHEKRVPQNTGLISITWDEEATDNN